MMRLLQWFRALRIFAGHMPLCRQEQPQWSDHDSRTLSAWLHSPTGVKLIELIRYFEQTQNASAVQKGTRIACGFACGWRAHAAWIISLSADSQPQSGDSQDSIPGAEELLDRLAP